MDEIIEKALKNYSLTKEEIIYLLLSDGVSLFKAANTTKKNYKGNEIHLRGLIEFTNICKQNCLYCGIRCANKKIERYRLTKQEILNCAIGAINAGYKTIVLQGGEDDFFDTDKLCEIIKEIKKYDVALTLSIGERTREEYKAFKDAGVDRYLLRIETTDEKLYKTMHPNMSLQNRKECLYNLKELGYETGTGCLVGLPNQTVESLAEDILFFKELNADMVGIGPFIAHPDTPLAKENTDNFDLALKVMATTRLLLPDINIPATTAMETLKPDGRMIALKSGANVVMPNVTDYKYKNKYELYPNKNTTLISDSFYERLQVEGLKISNSKGFRTSDK